MNDKDKEEFERWLAHNVSETQSILIHELVERAWKAACEYKQKEIDELKNITYWTLEQNGKVTRHKYIAEIE